jgi:hypothetical protein
MRLPVEGQDLKYRNPSNPTFGARCPHAGRRIAEMTAKRAIEMGKIGKSVHLTRATPSAVSIAVSIHAYCALLSGRPKT